MTRTSRPTPSHRYVYVIGPLVGVQKVGIATDPKQRLVTLQTACPFDLFLHLAVAVPFGDRRCQGVVADTMLSIWVIVTCEARRWPNTTSTRMPIPTCSTRPAATSSATRSGRMTTALNRSPLAWTVMSQSAQGAARHTMPV